jgi:hypothetical protein
MATNKEKDGQQGDVQSHDKVVAGEGSDPPTAETATTREERLESVSELHANFEWALSPSSYQPSWALQHRKNPMFTKGFYREPSGGTFDLAANAGRARRAILKNAWWFASQTGLWIHVLRFTVLSGPHLSRKANLCLSKWAGTGTGVTTLVPLANGRTRVVLLCARGDRVPPQTTRLRAYLHVAFKGSKIKLQYRGSRRVPHTDRLSSSVKVRRAPEFKGLVVTNRLWRNPSKNVARVIDWIVEEFKQPEAKKLGVGPARTRARGEVLEFRELKEPRKWKDPTQSQGFVRMFGNPDPFGTHLQRSSDFFNPARESAYDVIIELERLVGNLTVDDPAGPPSTDYAPPENALSLLRQIAELAKKRGRRRRKYAKLEDQIANEEWAASQIRAIEFKRAKWQRVRYEPMLPKSFDVLGEDPTRSSI